MADWLDDVVKPRESAGRPNIGWGNTDLTPYLNSGKTVFGFPDWPGLPGPQGVSTAAGLYGITKTNWKKYAPELGVNDFSAPSQRRVADAIMADQGKAAWAASEPTAWQKAHPNWREGRVYQGEGEPGPALHLTLHPPERPFLASLLAGLGGAGGGAVPDTPADPAEKPLLMALLSEPLASPLAGAAPAAGADAGGGIQPLPGPPPPAPDLLGTAPPLDPGQIAPVPAARGSAVAATPLLDRLVQSDLPVVEPGQMPPVAGSAMSRFGQGLAEGVALPGDELRQRMGTATPAEGVGAAIGRTPLGGLIDMVRGAGKTTEAALTGQPVGAGEAAQAAMIGLGSAPGGAVGSGIGRGPGFMPRTPPVSAPGKAVAKARETINALFSPTTVDPFSQEAEALIRQSTGMARRETDAANAAVEPYRAAVNQHVPEFDAWLRAKKAGTLPPDAPQPGVLRFQNFVETRSTGAAYDGPAELRPLADELRRIYNERRAAIAAEPSTERAAFIEDYYSHMWKETGQARTLMAGTPPRTGSGASLKERSIPTIADGIARGLTPATLDPIEMTMRYVANMDRFLAHNRTFRIGRESGAIRFHVPGAQPEGWDPLKGRLAQGPGQQAYAPAAFARIYNNAISAGVYEDRLGGQVYNAVLKTKNTLNSLVLGLSGFHAAAMAQEASASALARAVGAVSEGDMASAAKQLGLGGIPVVKSADDVFRTGRKLQRQYLRVDDYGADYEKVAGLLAEAGGRIVGRGQEWRGTAADNFFKSWKRGALRIEAMAAGREIAGNPLRLPLVAARELARLNDTAMAPIFDGMIPRLKSAAFFDEMKAWLDSNPGAGRSAQLAKARQIVDVVDDRFGELILDNVFWGKRVKQFLQLVTTSLGWELGTMRSGFGAGADLARGQWTPRVRYLIGLSGAVAIYNASYQYLKTGKAPEGVKDLVAPQTGGKTPEGVPERALLPGYEKDALGWWHNPTSEFANKLSPLGRLGGELVGGKDYFGHEIAPFAPGTPDWFKAYAGHIERAMLPIPLKQDVLKGSNIGMAERFMGNRPAPEYVQNPQRAEDMETARRLRDLQSKLRGLYLHGARTTQERGAIEKAANEIRQQIRQTQDDATKRRRERGPNGGRVINRMAIEPQPAIEYSAPR